MPKDGLEHKLKIDAAVARAGWTDTVFREDAFRRLVVLLLEFEEVAVAYSGGVDSTFLLRVAHGLLGDRAIGVLAFSESLDRNEFEAAKALAEQLAIPIKIIETREYDNPEYRQNDGDRCYHCKFELFDQVKAFAAEAGIRHAVDGSNADDTQDYRPGLRARDEHHVRSPLLDAGVDKKAVRRYSKALGLPTWDKPAAPCLSSRIPYGSEVTFEKLRQIEKVEAALRDLGFRVVRVRHHDSLARIEVPVEDLPRLMSAEVRPQVTAAAKAAGFTFVAADTEGFRSGSLNRVLTAGGSQVVPLEDVTRLD